jgi:hypothetical protein
MATTRSIKATAADKTMTLNELRKFVDECERINLPDSAPVKIRSTIGGGIKTIEASE